MSGSDARVPPYSAEYEQSFLGACLVNESILDTIHLLDASDFFYEQHQDIFTAIGNLYQSNKPVDIISVADELEKKKKLKSIGGITYLAKLADAVPNIANTEYYAHKIKELSLMRKGIVLAEKIEDSLYNYQLEEAREIAQKIEFLSPPDNTKPFSDMFDEEELKRLTSLPTWHSKHLPTLTKALPISIGELLVIAGKTSTGKTQVALNLLMDFLEAGATIGYVSLEMVKSQVLRRIIAYVDDRPLYNVKFDNDDEIALAQAVLQYPNFRNFKFRDDLTDINDIMEWAFTIKPDVMFIDYLQLVGDKSVSSREYDTLTSIARKIRTILTRRTSVITLSQMNRKRDENEEDEVDLSKIAGSGRIEQTATGIVFLQRRIPNPHIIRYRVLKNQSNGTLTDWINVKLMPNGELYEIP